MSEARSQGSGPFMIDDTEASSRQGDNDCAVLNSDLHIQVVLKAVSHARNITDVRFDGGAAAWPMAL